MLFWHNRPANRHSLWRQLKEKLGAVSDVNPGETPTFRKLFLGPSVTILASLVLTSASVMMALTAPTHRLGYVILPVIFTGTGIVALLMLLLRLRAHLLKPISQLRKWAAHVHSGDRKSTRLH